MKNQEEIKTAIYQYIADSIDCSIEQLESDDTCFVKNRKEEKDYIKILSIKDANIISCSEDKYEIGKQLLAGKIRDELYESTLIFGQTLHYIPNIFEAFSKKYKGLFNASLADKGSVTYYNGEKYFVPADEALEIVDTTGCGDSYHAGFVCSHMLIGDIYEAMRVGTEFATETLSHYGGF